MEFIARKWAWMLLASIAAAGFVLMLVIIFSTSQLPDHSTTSIGFMGTTLWIAYLAFFAGFTALCIMRIFNVGKLIRAYTKMGMGVVATVFLILALVHAIDTWESAYRAWELQTPYAAINFPEFAKFIIFPVIAQLFIIGLFPLIKGVKQVLDVHLGKDKAK